MEIWGKKVSNYLAQIIWQINPINWQKFDERMEDVNKSVERVL